MESGVLEVFFQEHAKNFILTPAKIYATLYNFCSRRYDDDPDKHTTLIQTPRCRRSRLAATRGLDPQSRPRSTLYERLTRCL